MDNRTPQPPIDPALIAELVDAAREAADAMCESLNLDLAVGNDDFEDVKTIGDALDRLSAALASVRRRRRISDAR